MHPSDKQWWLSHAGDYVLGLLSDPDRLVFERIMQVDPEVHQLVVDWREKLQPMSDALTPVEPPAHILASLVTNLPEQPMASGVPAHAHGHNNSETVKLEDGAMYAVADENEMDAEEIAEADKQAALLADGTAFQRMLDGKQKSADGWRSFAGWATVACVLGGIVAWMGFDQLKSLNTDQPFDSISVVADDSKAPLWIVDSSADAKVLRATAINPPEAESGKAYELWVNKSDDSLVSMGMLPTSANASSQFNAHKFDPEASSFSVSLEPADGSPQSLPTGPILYRGSIERLQID